MARNGNELNRKVLQNLRTSGSNEQIIAKPLDQVLAAGEIAVQLQSGETTTEKKINTGLWTLAHDGTTPVRFPSEERVEQMIETGASQSVEELSAVVKTQVSRLDEKIDGLSAGTEDAIEDLAQQTAVAIAAEEARAKAAESALTEAVETLRTDAETSADTLNTNIETEKARAKAAEDALEDKIDAETARAESAETSLAEAIQKLKDAAVVNEDGSITVVTGGTDGTEISVHIKSGEKVIKLDGNGGGLYTDIKISGASAEELATLGTNVKEAYKLLDSDGNKLGDWIKIYKDSSLYRAYLGHVDDTITSDSDPTVIPGSGDTALCFIYRLADGTYQLVAINVESFLEESEFADGLEVNNHVVSVKVDDNSESFLTVGPDGLKLDGVQDAIDEAVLAEEERATSAETKLRYDLDTLSASVDAEMNEIVTSIETLSAGTIDEDADLQRQINDLKSGSTADIAELSAATVAEIARAESAESALDGVIGSVKGDNDESRTYGHSGTNYLDNSQTVKSDAETLDGLLGADTATTFNNTDKTVAKTITGIKARLDELEAQSVVGEDTTYGDITVSKSGDVTTIKVDVKAQDIATSSAVTDGLATAYDVKTFAVSDVKDTAQNSTNVTVINDEGVRKLDLRYLVVDCGEF